MLALIMVAVSMMTVSCTLMQQPVAVAPVGPAPGSQLALADTGFLKVFTDMKFSRYDDMFYATHTDYGVYDDAGKLIKSVQNAESFHSPTPMQVALPPGHYIVEGWSDAYKLVKVPVLIEAGSLTTVNLEKDDHGLFPGGIAADLVHTPDGRIVGWPTSLATR
jgi:hypothetical protein